MKKFPHILFFLLCVQLLLLATTLFTAWPEMLFWPYLILNNWLPYKNIAIAHTPLMIADLSIWYTLAGLGIAQLKVYTWLIITITTSLIFYASGGNKKQYMAVISTLVYIAINLIYEGNGLWFDLLLAPLALWLYISIGKKQFFLSGIIFAGMLLTKQTAFWFAPIAIYALYSQKDKMLAFKKSALGFLSVCLIFVFLLSLLGITTDFWKWAIEFGIFTLPRAQGQISPPAMRQIIFALLPFSILAFTRKKSLIFWAIAGAMGAFPRFELFHFQPALPFIALSVSTSIFQKKHKFLYFYLFVITALLAISLPKKINKPVRFYNQSTINFSHYLNEKTRDNSKIYVINDWDSIYTLSNTFPATDPWVPHLPWYMTQQIQEEIVNDLKEQKPEFIVQKPFENSGLGSFKPELIMEYIYKNYKTQGTIEGRILLRKI